MNSTVVPRGTEGRIQRRVEHLMGMPISVALRGRHAASAAGREAWRAVIDQAAAGRRDVQYLSAGLDHQLASIAASSQLRNVRPR